MKLRLFGTLKKLLVLFLIYLAAFQVSGGAEP
jgi:hypothetical protein